MMPNNMTRPAVIHIFSVFIMVMVLLAAQPAAIPASDKLFANIPADHWASEAARILSEKGDDRFTESGGNISIGTSTPISSLTLNGSLSISIVVKTSDYMLTDSDYFVAADATTGGLITITLPTAVGIVGRVYVIKRVNGTGDFIKVATNGSETIDGDSYLELQAQHDSVQLVSDGSNWLVISFSSAGAGQPRD